MERLCLSHLGIVNALGEGASAILQGVLEPSQCSLVRRADLLLDASVWVGAFMGALPDITQAALKHRSRNNRLLWSAYLQIAPAVTTLVRRYGAHRVAVVMGSSTSGIAETEQALVDGSAGHHFPASYHYNQQEMGSPAEFLAEMLGLKNVALTISTACSSSGKAFASARNLIETGFCDAALVGGADSLCRLTLNGFNALESVSASRCMPFSRHRDGISIGEGAALFVLQPELQGEEIELLGVGESSDAYHMSAPDPEGHGAEAAMRQALAEAALMPAEIAYINLHGTATLKNDAMEAAVVNRLFGAQVPCSSTKNLTGHALGAAAATELGICWLLLSTHNATRQLPAQGGEGEWDERLAPIHLVPAGLCYNANGDCCMMSNSFAFGGSNVSLIIRRRF